MSFNFKEIEIKESMRIKGSSITISVFVATAKDGDYFVTVSPTLLVSGYGSTEEESRQSFQSNIELFCHDIMAQSKEQRELYLIKLGFTQEKIKTKNFSKLYVDESGVLHGLEQSTVKTSMLEATV